VAANTSLDRSMTLPEQPHDPALLPGAGRVPSDRRRLSHRPRYRSAPSCCIAPHHRCADIPGIVSADHQTGSGYLKFRNDRVVAENLRRGEGIRMYRGVPAAGPPACLHQYGLGWHDPLALLPDAVPFRSAIETARSQAARQCICRPKTRPERSCSPSIMPSPPLRNRGDMSDAPPQVGSPPRAQLETGSNDILGSKIVYL
jgi:hypothetical protein